MKIALILASNCWFSPYLNLYTSILDSNGINYDIISWNRDLSEPETPTTFSDKRQSNNKLKNYINYVSFVKSILYKNKYDKLIVFSPQIALLLSKTLILKYPKRYAIDYRDLSIEQNQLIKPLYSQLLNHSGLNVISSPGYKKYLPPANYIISHNINNKIAKSAIGKYHINKANPIKILTIGSIRDYESNIDVINGIANITNFELYFVGKGIASDKLQNYVKHRHIKNVFFSGYYTKKDEPTYIIDASLLNIFYPQIKSHISALSNRFYNSLIFKRPMIVTKHSIQGDYAEKYNIGISLENCKYLSSKIITFFNNIDNNLYETQCDKLLNIFIDENILFEKEVINFVLK